MVRSVWKGPYYEWSVMRKVQQLIASGIPQKEPIKVYSRYVCNPLSVRSQFRSIHLLSVAGIVFPSRRSMIVPQFIGYKFAIHNGRKFEPLEVRDVHLGKKVRRLVCQLLRILTEVNNRFFSYSHSTHFLAQFGDFSFTRAKPRSIYEKEEKAAAAAAKAAPKK